MRSPIASNATGPSCTSTPAGPTAATAAIIEALGPQASGLRTLEVLHPSLEAVFLELTGRRYEPAVEEELGDVR